MSRLAMSPVPNTRRRPAALRALLAALAGLLLALLPGAPAQAAPMFGHDISWPQCPEDQGGYGLPMPPESTEFVIIGLTRGLPFTQNPCLADQVEWVASRDKPAHGYTMAAYPTTDQLSTYGGSGPWSSATLAGRLSNAGYAEGTYALNTLQSVGFDPPVVWIDVEPRPAQPWPTASAADQRANRYVIEGLMRRLRDAGKAYGLYSFTNGWRDITGSWWLPGVPVWATAGRLDYPDEALDRCTQPSFSRGRVYISQWYDDERDYDRTCEPYQFTPLPVAPSALSNSSNDFSGDWNNDVLARLASNGELWLYPGNGNAGWLAPFRVGHGWGGMNVIETPGDFNGDGPVDVIARSAATAELWLYPGTGSGGWLTPVRIGRGWDGMNAIVGPGDFNGDQHVDVLARRADNGDLWLYPGTGTGGWLNPVRVGTGWNVMNAVFGPGDFNGDRHADVLARRTDNGELWLYPGNGTGGWLTPVRVGTGWNGLDAVFGPGDFNGDRTVDVLARRPATGDLLLYPGNGTGGWLSPVRVGTGWNGVDSIS